MAKTIKIGHASQSEGVLTGYDANGKPKYTYRDGVAGDSNKKEVYINEKSNITTFGYHILLRPKDSKIAEASAKACEAACKNDKIGYSQYATYGAGRLTLYNEAKKVNFDLSKITTACNTDCSAFMAVCAIAAGVDVNPSSTTRSMCNNFKNSDKYEVLTDSIYFSSSDYLKRGDILLKEGSHTVMVLANGSKVPKTEEKATEQKFEQETVEITDTEVLPKILVLALNLTSVNTEQATIKANIIKIENNKETDISDSNIQFYKWAYTLESLKNSKIVTQELKIDSSPFKFSLDNLTANNLYRLKITATETNSEAVFSSPWLIFMTNSERVIDDTKKEFKLPSNNCKIFIKIKDVFRRATLYK